MLHTLFMLDVQTEFVLYYILKFSKSAKEYVVLDVDDLILQAPKRLLLTKEKAIETIKYLNALNYVNLRYLDDASFCLTATQKAISYEEENKREKAFLSRRNAQYFKWSFLGGFSGSLVAVLIFLISCFG